MLFLTFGRHRQQSALSDSTRSGTRMRKILNEARKETLRPRRERSDTNKPKNRDKTRSRPATKTKQRATNLPRPPLQFWKNKIERRTDCSGVSGIHRIIRPERASSSLLRYIKPADYVTIETVRKAARTRSNGTFASATRRPRLTPAVITLVLSSAPIGRAGSHYALIYVYLDKLNI